ncbi:MAG: 4Fe-4S dicluster domain-containing protein [Chloroflexi bacterium]|nr:4Fe-4S dicluster domain-containing protein [Chloroflexota bacterium]
MVIDLKKCEGCVTIDAPPQCTQACIAGHYVPKGQEWIQVFEVGLPTGGSSFMPTPCFQCENAPCVNVCPVSATYHNEDGIVLIDHRRCIGCRLCMAACPYQRRFFNWTTPELPPEAAFAEYSPFYPVPAVKGTVIKCMFCAHMLEDGKLPLCVTGCPMKALYMGDFIEDFASNGNEVVKLSKFLADNDAFRYKENLGTQPRVWYLPGHGQLLGRKADDPRQFKPPEWTWGGEHSWHSGTRQQDGAK